MSTSNRQYRTIAALAVLAGIIVGLVLYLLGQVTAQCDKFCLAYHTSIAFWIGAACSALAGYIGMYVAVKSKSITASPATRSLGKALMGSMRGGPVSCFLLGSLSLLGR